MSGWSGPAPEQSYRRQHFCPWEVCRVGSSYSVLKTVHHLLGESSRVLLSRLFPDPCFPTFRFPSEQVSFSSVHQFVIIICSPTGSLKVGLMSNSFVYFFSFVAELLPKSLARGRQSINTRWNELSYVKRLLKPVNIRTLKNGCLEYIQSDILLWRGLKVCIGEQCT